MVLRFALLTLLAIAPGAAGRDRPDEGFQPVAAESTAGETRSGWERRTEKELEQIDRTIENLEDDARNLGMTARHRARKQLRELRRQQDEVEERLREARRSSSRRWDIVKGGVEDAMHELELMLDRLQEREGDEPGR